MQTRHELPYETTAAKVFAMLADPAFREQVCADQDVVSVEVDISRSGKGMSVVIDQLQRTPVPGFARKVMGETTQAVQREDWHDRHHADLVIETPGLPATISGTITLERAGTGTVEVVDLHIRCGIPLIGGRLEKLFGDLIAKAIRSEHRTGQAWLKGPD
jgi:Protein of unknown function (DUF2505)